MEDRRVMKKRTIVFVSLLVVFFMLMIPNISTIEVNAVETTVKEKITEYEKNLQSLLTSEKENTNHQQVSILHLLHQATTLKNNGGLLNKILLVFLFNYFLVFSTVGYFINKILHEFNPIIDLLDTLVGPDFPENNIQMVIRETIIILCSFSNHILSFFPVYLMISLLGETGVLQSMRAHSFLLTIMIPVLLSTFVFIILEKQGIIPASFGLPQTH